MTNRSLNFLDKFRKRQITKTQSHGGDETQR